MEPKVPLGVETGVAIWNFAYIELTLPTYPGHMTHWYPRGNNRVLRHYQLVSEDVVPDEGGLQDLCNARAD